MTLVGQALEFLPCRNNVFNVFGYFCLSLIKMLSYQENPVFAKAIRCGQFYFMDKFILLASGNALNMYKFHVDTSKSDVKRYDSDCSILPGK